MMIMDILKIITDMPIFMPPPCTVVIFHDDHWTFIEKFKMFLNPSNFESKIMNFSIKIDLFL